MGELAVKNSTLTTNFKVKDIKKYIINKIDI